MPRQKETLSWTPQQIKNWIWMSFSLNENLEILLFADDTCCFASGKEPAETAVILNRDLERLKDWATKWKVIFNPGKK